MCGFDTKLIFDVPNESQTSTRNHFRPASIAKRQPVFQPLLSPLLVCSLKIFQIRKPTQLAQALEVDYRVTLGRLFHLSKAALLPLPGMIYHASSSHVQINIGQAAME